MQLHGHFALLIRSFLSPCSWRLVEEANKAGAVAGMIGGFGGSFWYLYMVQFGGMTPWYGIDDTIWYDWYAVSLILMVVVSLMTEEPDKETQDMVDAIRVPKGKAVLAADH